MPITISVIKLGRLSIIGFSGEVFLEYGIFAKELFGSDTIVLGYTQGCQTYIPTKNALKEGGYETWAWKRWGQFSSFTPEVENTIKKALLQIYNQEIPISSQVLPSKKNSIAILEKLD